MSTPVRLGKFKLTPEDELMFRQQEHDLHVQKKKLKLEEVKQDTEFNFEQQRLDMDRSRLEIEMKKEERLAKESERRDEMATAQLKLQNNMCELMMALSKVNKQV